MIDNDKFYPSYPIKLVSLMIIYNIIYIYIEWMIEFEIRRKAERIDKSIFYWLEKMINKAFIINTSYSQFLFPVIDFCFILFKFIYI